MFLDSEESLKKFKGGRTWDEIFDDPAELHHPKFKGYKLEDFKENRNSWCTFNQFFYRRFSGANHKNGSISPTRNTIDEPNNNKCIASPAHCTFKEKVNICCT